MTLFEHVLLQARDGLSEIDRDRDRALTFIARYGGSPGLDVYLEDLAIERARQLLMIQGLHELRQQKHPALFHQVRFTRMMKATLRPTSGVKTGTGQ